MPCCRAIRVWDSIVRLTHWINALAVLALLALGGLIWANEALGLNEAAEDALIDGHAMIGFVLAASLTLRLAYLVAGPTGPSHWRDLIPADAGRRDELKRTLAFYLRGLRGEPPLYFAHNALAGLAYAAFFALALSQVLSGAAMYLLGPGIATAHAHEGGGHGDAASWPPEALVDWHEAGAVLIALFVLAHLAMVVVHELIESRGLASAMISGRKFFTDEELTRLGYEGGSHDRTDDCRQRTESSRA